MFKDFFLFEINHRLRRPMVYVFLIINFQYLWIIAFGVLLSISPFLSAALNLPKSLILWILLIGVAVHLSVFFRTALAIQKRQFDFLALPIRLF